MEEKIIKYVKIIIMSGAFLYIFINAIVFVKKGYNIDDLQNSLINEQFAVEKINNLLEQIDISNSLYYEKDSLDVKDINMGDKLAIASNKVSITQLTSNNSHYGKYYYMMENDDLVKQYKLLFADEYESLSFKNGSIFWEYIDGNYYSNDYRNNQELSRIKYVIKDKNVESDKLNIEIIPYYEINNSIYDINNNLIVEKSDDFDINSYKLERYVFTFIINKENALLKCINKIKLS